MSSDPKTYSPYDVVSVTVNPRMTMWLFVEMLNALDVPLTTTPGAAATTIGFPGLPEWPKLAVPLYVPAATCTVWPPTATTAALTIVQYGLAWVPAPVSEQAGLPRST